MISESNNIKGHKKRIIESYANILKLSINPTAGKYDEAILEKAITCIEHIFKATYIFKFNDDIDFDVTDKTSQENILAKVRGLEESGYTMSLNKTLGSLLKKKAGLKEEYFNIYCTINPERNKVTHKKEEVSQVAVLNSLLKIKSICNWFFSQFEEYDWEEKNIDLNLRGYEASFMSTLSSYLSNIKISHEYQSANHIPKSLEIITPESFNSELISDETTTNRITIDYYLKFNNNHQNIKKVIANKIHIPPMNLFSVKVEKEFKQLSFNDIILKAIVGQPVLVKIMAVGGVGKSTLLWHFIREFSNDYNTFFTKRADPDCVQYIFKEVKPKPEKPILIFLDDVVSYEENREKLIRFGETISEFSSVAPIVLIASERFYRYDKFKGKKEFEKNFPVEFTIPYSNSSIRDKVFEKLFLSLNLSNDVASQSLRNHCNKIFNQHEFDSLIDSAFNLIVYLKKDFPNINYRFDWEDWNEACAGKFETLNELFKIVAFFYQFGISVPLDFLKEYFNNVRNVNDLLRELLGTFHEQYSPIVLSVMDNGKPGLSLRHEKMGEWYFQIITGGKDSATEFFNDFLDNIKSKSASYLFRNLSRKNSEFQLSPYSKLLPNKKILEVIEKYFLQISEDKYEEEEFKMLMEKHFVLINLGKSEDSIEPLEKILKLKSDNVFAATRLAFSIQESDSARAEELFRAVLKEEGDNSYATFGLFNLYHDYPAFGEFDSFQEKVFLTAKNNLYFSNVLLQSLERNFAKLPASTIKHLIELYSNHKILGNDIAELLMFKGAFKQSYSVLSELEKDAAQLSPKYRSKTVQLLIKLHQVQNSSDGESLQTAERILRAFHQGEENDSETNFFFAKIYSLNKKSSNFKQAEKYFTKAFEQDKSGRIFFAITKFYRDFASHIIDRVESDLPQAIITLLKGINHIQARLKNQLTNKLPYEIELCIFYNEIVQAYFFHSTNLNDTTNKYPALISAIESATEVLLEKCLSELIAKLPKPSEDLFSNYLVDEDDVQLYSKVCSISYDFFSNKVKRIQVKKILTETEINLGNKYLDKAKQILIKSLEFNEDNPSLLINLIDVKISLKDNDIDSTIEKISFGKFSIKQKARLCRLLIRRGFKSLGVKLIGKFGQLNSTDIKIKNDLVLCYIEAKSWAYATKVFSDLKNSNDYTLELIKRLSLEMPTNNEERAKAKIAFSNEHIKRTKNFIRVLKQNICKTLFVTGNISESFKYFRDNRFHLSTQSEMSQNDNIVFKQISNEWHNELVDNLAKNIGIAETMVDKQGRLDDGLNLIAEYLDGLLSMKIDFTEINYNFKNENPFNEKVKTIIIKSINMIHTMFESRTLSSNNAFDLSFKLVRVFHNPLFNKVFLNKLIKSESDIIFSKCIPILKYLETNEKTDPDVMRMIGRCYMMRGKFPQAKYCFMIGQKLSTNNKQLCYSHNNLADWIVTKIEKEGIKSFGNETNIKKHIKEAEIHITKSKELFPEFQYQELLVGRLNVIKEQYK